MDESSFLAQEEISTISTRWHQPNLEFTQFCGVLEQNDEARRQVVGGTL